LSIYSLFLTSIFDFQGTIEIQQSENGDYKSVSKSKKKHKRNRFIAFGKLHYLRQFRLQLSYNDDDVDDDDDDRNNNNRELIVG
jgi:hypothetical protein